MPGGVGCCRVPESAPVLGGRRMSDVRIAARDARCLSLPRARPPLSGCRLPPRGFSSALPAPALLPQPRSICRCRMAVPSSRPNCGRRFQRLPSPDVDFAETWRERETIGRAGHARPARRPGHSVDAATAACRLCWRRAFLTPAGCGLPATEIAVAYASADAAARWRSVRVKALSAQRRWWPNRRWRRIAAAAEARRTEYLRQVVRAIRIVTPRR